MLKRIRQQAIIDILSRQAIPNQAVLSEELEKLNLNVTQATISRDVTELKLIKSRKGYMCPQDADGTVRTVNLSPMRTLRFFVLRIDIMQNLLIIQTMPGSAHQVLQVLDSLGLPEIVGNVADYKTVLTIMRTSADAQKTKSKLLKMIP